MTLTELAGFALSMLVAGAGPSRSDTLAIEHVTVIDALAGRRLPDRTVVLAAGRIVGVERGPAPTGASRVDGRGKLLIPGLWDMHVHAAEPRQDTLFAHLLLANGVTGVRGIFIGVT